MTKGTFDAPVFIKQNYSTPVDPSTTQFFYNDGGQPVYVEELPSSVIPIAAAATNPNVGIGREYVVSEIVDVKQTPPYGVETQLGLIADKVIFEPMWATRAVAAAFGITLVKQGQGVQLSSPSTALAQIEYEYGVYAGHWSPYQGPSGNKTLLTVECTDLEHHDFPHVFASTDPKFPLVVSVGRYWPKLDKICLADLWVPRGEALYIPPKPALEGAECLDLHNNRNSARACWGDIEHNSIVTHTLLQPDGAFYYWYWNPTPTNHSNLVEKK